MMDTRNLVCLNNGGGTRLDVNRNKMSCTDLTLVSASMYSLCDWEIYKDNIGSDHFPIMCTIEIDKYTQERAPIYRWCFKKAQWNTFKVCCRELANSIKMEGNVDECTAEVTNMISEAASKSISKTVIRGNKRMVPWWNHECSLAIKERNIALRNPRNNLSLDNLIEYKRKRARARKIIKIAKRNTWRDFCSTIGRERDVSHVWNVLRKMSGRKAANKISVLANQDCLVITDVEKANVLGRIFANVHSGNHLTDIHKRRKEDVLKDNGNVYTKKVDCSSATDRDFSLREMRRALKGSNNSAPGPDQLSYVMFRQLPEEALEIVLKLFNKIW